MSLKSELYLEDARGKAPTLKPLVKHQDLGAVILHLLADLIHLLRVGLNPLPGKDSQPLVLSLRLLRVCSDHIEQELVTNTHVV